MKAISLFKLLTLVCFLLVGLSFTAQAAPGDCANPLNVSRTTNCETKYKGDDAKIRQCAEAVECLVAKKDDEDRARQDRKDLEGECKNLLSKYDDAAKKIAEECSRVGEENYAKCAAKSKSCSQGLNAFAEPGSGGEDSTADALVSLIGVYSQMQGANTGANGQSVAGCVIENSDSEAEKEERLDQKITDLREKITELRNEKPAAEDEKLNEKRQDVEEKMLEARQENEKSQHEAKTKNQETAARLAEDIIKFNEKKKQRASQIADMNDQIAKVTEETQKIVLSMADSLIQTQCKKSKKKYQAEMLEEKKKTGTQFSNSELRSLEAEVREMEGKCLQLAARERQDALNAKNREKSRIKRAISNIESQTASEAQSMANKQKEIENLKTLGSEKEKKDLENLTTKLNNLNKSVTDLEAAVEKRKKSFEEKAKALEDQINKILQDRQNVKPKFSKVYSAASSGGASARTFVSQCCATDRKTGGDTTRTTVKGFADSCTRLRSDYDIKDAKVSTSKPGTGK